MNKHILKSAYPFCPCFFSAVLRIACITVALIILPVRASPQTTKDGEILNSKPYAPLPSFEALDDFGRGYFPRAIYDEARTQGRLRGSRNHVCK